MTEPVGHIVGLIQVAIEGPDLPLRVAFRQSDHSSTTMKIESLRIQNFRCFADETITFDDYMCVVGANGAGKSTIIAALNVFFRQYKDTATDLSKLSAADFHHRNVDDPVRITVTFTDLTESATQDLLDYVRNDKLIVSAVATYDPTTERADVIQYGTRLGIDDFKIYFEADKKGESATELKSIFQDLRSKFDGLDDAKTKAAMVSAMHEYESNNRDLCVPIRSEDQFYGATRGTNRLASHVQWIFVSAVKDITEESHESRNSGLGELLARTIRSKVSFSSKIHVIRESIRAEYQAMLDGEQSVLDDLSVSIEAKLKDWAHPDVSAKVLWTQDADKSVKVEEPWAYVRIGERGFEAELARFGHGMQRSFMLTLLQELANVYEKDAPTLVLAIEEPELYQHPPQARYLSEVLRDLTTNNAQVVVCSHSPLFIPGDNFEEVRLVREHGNPSFSIVSQLSYSDLSNDLEGANQKAIRETGMVAKMYPTLNPTVGEMFFCRHLILTEGIEDVAFITSYLELSGLLSEFRKFGSHIVPVGGKSKLMQPLAIARRLSIPVYTVFDADTNATDPEHIRRHKADNESILLLSGHDDIDSWPTEDIFTDDLVMWKFDIGSTVASDIGTEWQKYRNKAEAYYGQPGGLSKNPLAIARTLELAWEDDHKSESLLRLCHGIVELAKSSHATGDGG